jgi:site-specific recombinase XerC
MEVPDFIVPYLEEYLSFWRPFIASSDHSDLLFITISGTPYRDADDFNFWIQRGLYKWLGKRINPHLIRDIVATEIINETGNYVAAAALLNDEPATMFKHYWHLQQQKAADTADAWIAKKMNVV